MRRRNRPEALPHLSHSVSRGHGLNKMLECQQVGFSPQACDTTWDAEQDVKYSGIGLSSRRL